MLESGLPGFALGNTGASGKTLSPTSFLILATISTARALKGTRCSRLAFIRLAGIVHTLPLKSISLQVAPITSPVRAAVKIANSSARAAVPSCSRNAEMNPPMSA